MVDTVVRACSTTLALIVAVALVGCGRSRASERARDDAAPPSQTLAPLGAGHQLVKAGKHVLDLTARDRRGTGPPHLPKIEVTLPAGWFNYDGWALLKQKRSLLVGVSFWDIAQIYPAPCRWFGKPLVGPGPGVDGLASALARQPLRDATAPTVVSLAGFRGKYLELSVPANIDFADCDEGTFESWTAYGWSSDRYQQAPGQVDRIWILDVDGELLAVDATYLPKASSRDRAELDAVVRSIRFVR